MAREDLVPMNERTEAEQKEIATKGGKASGIARRKKKTMREAAKLILSMSVQDVETIEALKNAGIEDPEGMNNLEAMIAIAAAKAKGGDMKALEFLRDTIGENPQIAAYQDRTSAMREAKETACTAVDDWVKAVFEADRSK